MNSNTEIVNGIDVLVSNPSAIKQKKAALVTNDAAVTKASVLSRVALMNAGVNMVKLFSPEHGISSMGDDGVFQNDSTDVITKLPVISLYTDKMIPSADDLEDVEIILFDLPDVGCRFYTYQWTLSYIMEACSRYHKSLIVLDRPNPLSGNLLLAEGPLLDEINCSSFIGRWNIPLRHSLTIGELASYWNKTKNLSADLTIITVDGWNRNLFFDELSLPFVPTSPAIRDFETVLLYPGMGLLEGINVSEGRGTDTPFKICGAPFIAADELCNAFTKLNLPGIKAISCSFIPKSGKYENKICSGIKLLVTDKHLFRPVSMGLSLINLLLNLYPTDIKPHLYKTAANPTGERHLDKLTGIKNSFLLMQKPVNEFQSMLPSLANCKSWEKKIQSFLLY